ncbi:MAG: winged helix-turn-helix domain-containing protein [Thioalkalivibrio sp.]|nr:winged helix-turn-helix domain-containing protein [Thioalkalivibrio sp.]
MPTTPERLKFGDCEFDPQSGELWRNGDSVVLPNQLFRLLVVLIERAGTLVTRDELCRELWGEGTFVDYEHSLNAGVRRLREAIGDSAAAPRFIETVPQRGYRFIASVEDTSAGAAATSLPDVASPPFTGIDPAGHVPASRPRPSKWTPFGAAVLVALPLLFAFHGSKQAELRSDVNSHTSLVRLTSASGLSTEPALSADGTFLAYASDRAGSNLDLYVQPVAGGDPVRLTSDGADDSEPSFSPDGGHIVFSRRGGGLYVIGSLGGEPRLIVRTPWARTPRFSPDGRSISYWTGFPASAIAGGIPGAVGSIYIVQLDGRSPREIPTQLASARYPIWSPEGSHLLFLGEEDTDQKTHDWYVIPSNGGTAIKTGVVEALRAAGLRSPLPIPGTWSARNHAVVFATNETDSSNVWQIGISPSTKRVDRIPEPLTFGTAIERNPIIADSGRVVFASLVENVDIWRVRLDEKTGQAAGSLERITDNAASDKLRSVSADGNTLFFISSRTARNEVWAKDLGTGRERQLTHTGVIEASASPDGSRVAFSTADGGKRRIEIVGTADRASSRLCDQCEAPGGWSLDGKRLLYSGGVPSGLFLYEFDSKRQTQLLTHSKWSLQRPRFTPDGRSVTFHTASSPNVRRIYSAPLGVEVPQRSWVPVVTDHGCHPSWSPDGVLLYHFSSRDGAFCPWVQKVDPATARPIGAPRAVMHFHHPRLRATSGAEAFEDVQAGYLYMTLTEATGNIWMIDERDD